MLEDIIYLLKPFTPLMILVAAFLDTFIGTGYLLYGFTMLATVGLLHIQEMVTVPEIIISAWIGTTAASVLNYSIGRWCGHTQFVIRRLDSRLITRLNHLLDRYGNWWFIVIGRSVTFLRPSYALVLGLLHRPWRRFILYETIIALVWVTFWIGVIIAGEELLF